MPSWAPASKNLNLRLKMLLVLLEELIRLSLCPGVQWCSLGRLKIRLRGQGSCVDRPPIWILNRLFVFVHNNELEDAWENDVTTCVEKENKDKRRQGFHRQTFYISGWCPVQTRWIWCNRVRCEPTNTNIVNNMLEQIELKATLFWKSPRKNISRPPPCGE